MIINCHIFKKFESQFSKKILAKLEYLEKIKIKSLFIIKIAIVI